MTDDTVTPDTVFAAVETSDLGVDEHDDAHFRHGEALARPSAQEQYKRLIHAETARQGLPLAHLADRLGIARPRLHKIIKGQVVLQDDLRDRLFAALDIDAVRARFCVALLHDHEAYTDPDVFLVCEAMKGFYFEIITRRRGEIQVSFRPAIIHETQRRAYDMLLSHQARVLENDRTLQA